jgi:wyosine [tRNA(Phe)-imidazoG37] synthetase (radical SAM superfamily)
VPKSLSINQHNRDSAGLTYVYPVLSRRAGGLSIGINVNTNNACNWRCIYCQVPDLVRGAAPAVDLDVLARELRGFLQQVADGRFYDQFQIPPEQRVIKDIALSGNGEPTSVPDFAALVSLIGDIAQAAGLFPASQFVLISNGSLVHRAEVQAGLATLHRYNGQLWFKVDSGCVEGRRLINSVQMSQPRLLQHLKIASGLCRTKLQTCMLQYAGQAWNAAEKQAYLELLVESRQQGITIESIMLYSIARESHQPEGAFLKKVSAEEMQAFAADIKALGFDVSVAD